MCILQRWEKIDKDCSTTVNGQEQPFEGINKLRANSPHLLALL